jgi:hypothetical protein
MHFVALSARDAHHHTFTVIENHGPLHRVACRVPTEKRTMDCRFLQSELAMIAFFVVNLASLANANAPNDPPLW